MKIKLRRPERDNTLYGYGEKLIYSMGILFALSAFTNTSLVIALLVIVLIGTLF